MRPRYDAGYGLFLLVLSVGFLVLFDVPLDPTAWSNATEGRVALAGMALMFAAGVSGLVAARRPHGIVAGRRIDHLTFRGVSTLLLGVAMLLLGGFSLAGSDLSGLLNVAIGAFLLLLGVGTMQRRPAFVSAGDLTERSA
ncbi:hypothetical protein [Halomarina rubra]|uniref:Uncharacterized protein n=1 Tax=Halomarina rubra TaxID=2071873 RepID=A0ABD6AVD2_9EURY|nr:hypothetical protein [Halomarina rubra]